MKRFIFRWQFGVSDWIAGLVALCVLAWLAVPSGALLRPVSYSINGEWVTFVREVPFGQVSAKWATEIRAAGKQCNANGGPTVYETGDMGERLAEARYRLNAPVLACTGPEGFDMSQTHTVMIFGAIPLRATESLWRCPSNNGAPCVRLR